MRTLALAVPRDMSHFLSFFDWIVNCVYAIFPLFILGTGLFIFIFIDQKEARV